MKRKNWIWITALAVMLFITACAPKDDPVDPLVGTLAPDFQLENAFGGQVSLQEVIA